jgi:ubiquinone/menaquinone biosynthesis C-methylase UbiE
LPALSPYIRQDRYAAPKEDHKFFERKLREKIDVNAPLNVVDVGCGNGELLYLLKQKFPHWNLTGYDFTPEFIETGKNFPGLSGVELIAVDMFDIKRTFDVVLSDGVIQIFPEVQKPLEKMISICNDRGHVFVNGRFNKFDIEVRLQYCDNTNEISRGIWRADWNQHSRQSIIRLFGSSVQSIEFQDVNMDKDLPLNPDMPINSFTFRDINGRNIITNGVNMILNRTMLIIKK